MDKEYCEWEHRIYHSYWDVFDIYGYYFVECKDMELSDKDYYIHDKINIKHCPYCGKPIRVVE